MVSAFVKEPIPGRRNSTIFFSFPFPIFSSFCFFFLREGVLGFSAKDVTPLKITLTRSMLSLPLLLARSIFHVSFLSSFFVVGIFNFFSFFLLLL